jgi:DnaD/phage-associated family protein
MNLATDERPPIIVIDQAVIDDYHLHPLAGWLYVVIVRHVNRKKNDAFPSIPRLARLANMSKASVLRYTKVLEDAGLIRVTREKAEDGDNAVNHYHLLEVKRGISQQPGVVSDRNHRTITQQPPVVSESNHNQIQLNQIQEPKVVVEAVRPADAGESAEQPSTTTTSTANAFKLWEQEIGVLTPLVSDAIKDWHKNYPAGWAEEAIREARLSSGKSISPKYVQAILDRWKQDGKNSPRHASVKGAYAKPAAPAALGIATHSEGARAILERHRAEKAAVEAKGK